MATHIWNSSGTDFSVAGAWSSGVAPAAWVSTDKVIFPATATSNPTTGLDQTAIVVDAMIVEYGCPMNIGQAGTPLKIGYKTWLSQGKGTIYLQKTNAAAAPSHTVHAASHNAGTLSISGTTQYYVVACASGAMTMQAGVEPTITLLTTIDGNDRSSTLTIQSGASEIYCDGGTLVLNGTSASGNLVIAGGFVDHTTGLFGKIHVAGGLYISRTPTSPCVDLTAIGGTIDTLQLATPRTVTTIAVSRRANFMRNPKVFTATNIEFDINDVLGLP